MESLLEGLLQFTPLASHSPSDERVDLSAIAEECVALLRASEPQRQVDVTIQRNLVTRADPGLMRLVLQNLLSNAWKFTRPRPDARIAFEREPVEDAGAAPVFVVRDNGVGFEMVHAPRVFAPFERLHADEAFCGAGLGLAIVRRAVERQGGSVWVHAGEGEGARFYFQV